jgi:hypothetical protein
MAAISTDISATPLRWSVPSTLDFLSIVDEPSGTDSTGGTGSTAPPTLRLVDVAFEDSTKKMYFFRYMKKEYLIDPMWVANYDKLVTNGFSLLTTDDRDLFDYVVRKYAYSVTRSPEIDENEIPIDAIRTIDRILKVGDAVDVFTIAKPEWHRGRDDDRLIGKLETGFVGEIELDGDVPTFTLDTGKCRIKIPMSDPNWQFSASTGTTSGCTVYDDDVRDPRFEHDFQLYRRYNDEFGFWFSDDDKEKTTNWYRKGRVLSPDTQRLINKYTDMDEILRIVKKHA